MDKFTPYLPTNAPSFEKNTWCLDFFFICIKHFFPKGPRTAILSQKIHTVIVVTKTQFSSPEYSGEDQASYHSYNENTILEKKFILKKL